MLDLNYYSGDNAYSDGSIEQVLLEKVENKMSTQEILGDNTNWPTFYHFSPIRQDLLNWYPFIKGNFLEIGAGLGALTSLFCEKMDNVCCVELSKARATVIEKRCEQYQNKMDLIVGNFMEIPNDRLLSKGSFDYISLIGVLEYSKSFIHTQDPYATLLNKIKPLLKNDGFLIIAIENQMGLKYWSGFPEDHTGVSFSGIENYENVNESELELKPKVETFGKNALINLLDKNNFKVTQMFYPYPDYKFPSEIFSDAMLPDNSCALGTPMLYDQDAYEVFKYELAMKSVIKNELFSHMSNSFLVFAQKRDLHA